MHFCLGTHRKLKFLTTSTNHSLGMPPRVIILLPTHTPRSPVDDHATSLQVPLKITTGPGLPRGLVAQRDTPTVRISIRGVKRPLDARQEVVVLVYPGGGRELAALNVGSRVTLAGTLGPDLVASVAFQGAGFGRAARAAVFRFVAVAYFTEVGQECFLDHLHVLQDLFQMACKLIMMLDVSLELFALRCVAEEEPMSM